MLNHVFHFQQSLQMKLDLCLAPTKILTNESSREAILGLFELLSFALRANQLEQFHQQPPRLRRQFVDAATQDLICQAIGQNDVGHLDFDVLNRFITDRG